MREFRRLKVWEKGYRLTLHVYEIVAVFHREEEYALTSQMRRSCAAIPANTAEGCGWGSNADWARFLQIAPGSASELENHLLLARDLSLLRPADYHLLIAEATALKAFADKPRSPKPVA